MKEPTYVDIFTYSVASDGGIVERICGNQLVRCLDGRIATGAEFACGGVLYRAGELPPGLEMALKLPAPSSDSDDAGVFTELKKLFRESAGLSKVDAVILTGCVLATWMSGFCKTFCLNLIGPQSATAAVKTLLSSLVRNPLSLGTFNLKGVASLPTGLSPTVLLSNPSTRALRELAIATAGEPLQTVQGGNVELLPSCSAVVCSAEPAPLAALRINLIGKGIIPLRPGELQAIEARLRPALLRFRLTGYATIDGLTSQCGDFSPEVQAWSQLLGAVVSRFPGATAEVVEALHPQDQAQQVSRADSLQGTVAEAVFLSIHADTTPPYVKDVAQLANLLLLGGGERELTTRGVGAIMRKLGFACERKGAGYRLVLSKDVRQRVHWLAQQLGIPFPVASSATCCFCAELNPPCAASGADFPSPDVLDVQDLDGIHSTRGIGCTEISAPIGRAGEEA